MKKTRALLLAAVFVASGIMTQTARAEHYGPVRSFLQQGESALGVGIGMDHDEWSVLGSKTLYRQAHGYAQYSLGLGHEWGLSARAGMTTMSSKSGAVSDYNSQPKPFIGGTVGGPLYKDETLAIGPVFQGSYVVVPFESRGAEIENLLKLSVAMMVQLEIEGASLYLGPAFSYGDATVLDNVDMEIPNRFTGVVGVRWLLPGSWPTQESKTYFDLEAGTSQFTLNRTDVTAELNFTY